MGVFRSFSRAPSPVVPKKIAKPILRRIEGMLQECQISECRRGSDRRGLATFLLSRFLQLHCENKRPSIVVGGISLTVVWNREDRVLEHSSVVSQLIDVLQVQFRQLIKRLIDRTGRELNMRNLHAFAANPRKTSHVALRYSFPDHLPRVLVGPFAHGMPYGRRVQEFDCLLCDGTRILERNESSA